MVLNGNTLTTILPLSDLYTRYANHKRLKIFCIKGRECVTCERVGTLLLITEGADGGIHIDLYTDDFILMTVDHIVPKKVGRELGWTKRQIEDILNKQPMCQPCNSSKGHKHITNEQFKKRIFQRPRLRGGTEVIRQLVGNSNIFNKELA